MYLARIFEEKKDKYRLLLVIDVDQQITVGDKKWQKKLARHILGTSWPVSDEFELSDMHSEYLCLRFSTEKEALEEVFARYMIENL